MDTEESAWLLDARNEDAESNCTAPTSKLVLSPDEARIERGTVRKVDLRLLLILGALYSISIIDRTNLSAARVAGMEKDLRLSVVDFTLSPYLDNTPM